jgi:hypothetical protein
MQCVYVYMYMCMCVKVYLIFIAHARIHCALEVPFYILYGDTGRKFQSA